MAFESTRDLPSSLNGKLKRRVEIPAGRERVRDPFHAGVVHVRAGAVAEHEGGNRVPRADKECADVRHRADVDIDAERVGHAPRPGVDGQAGSSATDWMMRPTSPYSTDSSALIQ